MLYGIPMLGCSKLVMSTIYICSSRVSPQNLEDGGFVAVKAIAVIKIIWETVGTSLGGLIWDPKNALLYNFCKEEVFKWWLYAVGDSAQLLYCIGSVIQFRVFIYP